ncbi:MAG TPA: response regulator transcription factor [Anaerolineae bacterium]|nr:response regulator transcription factor [Anaerolineae bacterium]
MEYTECMAGERILIVEDDPAVARGLVYGLEKEGFRAHSVERGHDAIRWALDHNPHLILLDVRLPDLSGFDVCRELRARGARLPILMVTARDEEVDRVLGLELGADDYVVKPFSLRELISRIRAHLRRAYGTLAPPAAGAPILFADVEVDLAGMHVRCRGEPVDLTATEFRLLAHLLRHPGQLFSRGALIEAVWGYDSDVLNERTVDVHVRHLREKLEADPSSPRHLVTVRGMGYRFEP